jgi:hypothetical protein
MPVILNASDCDFWLDVTALGACCEDHASLDPNVFFPQPGPIGQAPFSNDSPPARDESGTVRSFWSQVVARAGRSLT